MNSHHRMAPPLGVEIDAGKPPEDTSSGGVDKERICSRDMAELLRLNKSASNPADWGCNRRTGCRTLGIGMDLIAAHWMIGGKHMELELWTTPAKRLPRGLCELSKANYVSDLTRLWGCNHRFFVKSCCRRT